MNNKELNITGISRSKEFSPNHVDNDFAILSLVADELKNRKCKVNIYSEDEFIRNKNYGKIIFNMSRKETSIRLLKEIELSGIRVINSAFGVENCNRKTQTRLFEANGIPCPKSIIVSTNKELPSVSFPCWIKRACSHTVVKNDVVFAECREEADKVFEDFRNRNINEAVVNEHIVGDLIKFYGVYKTDFFYSFYPTEQLHSKFGLEFINGKPHGFHFDKRLLNVYCSNAAKFLNVPIYGGDCIIKPNGEIKIIDFNDWPSFAICRDIAAQYIADYIQNESMRY